MKYLNRLRDAEDDFSSKFQSIGRGSDEHNSLFRDINLVANDPLKPNNAIKAGVITFSGICFYFGVFCFILMYMQTIIIQETITFIVMQT